MNTLDELSTRYSKLVRQRGTLIADKFAESTSFAWTSTLCCIDVDSWREER
jgi:hypothetical protein